MSVIPLPHNVLDALLPMAVRISPSGIVEHVGPTLQKICADQAMCGQPFFRFFSVDRPFGITGFSDLFQRGHCKLRGHLIPTQSAGAPLSLRGSAHRLPDDGGMDGGMIVNLALGMSVLDAVARYGLDAHDFAPTDPTIDMLSLIETNNAAFEESRKLNQRLQDAKQVAEVEAATDPLTALKNRRALGQILERLSAQPEPFAIMNIDLDRFKEVNDCHGHAAGDYVLRAVADILLREVRSIDHVARAGGDEFVIVFERCNDLALLDQIARRIIEGLETPVLFDDGSCGISASIGIAVSSSYDRPDIETMLKDADQALYQAKQQGRGRAMVHLPEEISAARPNSLIRVTA